MLTDDGLRVDPFHDEFRLAALGEPLEGVAAEPLVNLTVGLAPGDILGPSPLGSDDAGAPSAASAADKYIGARACWKNNGNRLTNIWVNFC